MGVFDLFPLFTPSPFLLYAHHHSLPFVLYCPAPSLLRCVEPVVWVSGFGHYVCRPPDGKLMIRATMA